jgi:hypothetical protein
LQADESITFDSSRGTRMMLDESDATRSGYEDARLQSMMYDSRSSERRKTNYYSRSTTAQLHNLSLLDDSSNTSGAADGNLLDFDMED